MSEASKLDDQPSGLFKFLFLKTIFARLLLSMILVGGVLAASTMVKESSPDLEIAAATVITYWDGGDAATIEQDITTPIEKELKTLKGLKSIDSGSFAGFSVIGVEFQSDISPRDALQRLRGKVSQAEGELPNQARRPVILQASVNDSPIIDIRLFGERPLPELSALAKRLKKLLEAVPGANKAEISGDRERIVMVRLLGSKLDSLGISPAMIREAVQQANVDMPLGQFDGEQTGATFRFVGRFRNIEQLELLPIHRSESGRLIRLGELAEITETQEEERSRTFYSASGGEFKRAIGLSVTKRSGGDTIDIINQIQSALDDAKGRSFWPEGVEYEIVVDESININRDLTNVFNNGWQAMLAVFAILLVSLTWREALVAGLAIPIAFAGGLIIVAALGYSLNQIVIIGMVVALGLLVDVFILMMEGMHENMFVRGLSFGRSAIATVKTYAVPALSGQLTTILAMAPLIGIAGLTGKFIRPMPMAAIACLIASFVVALLLAIPLSRYVLPKSGTEVKKTKVDKLSEAYGNKLSDFLENKLLKTKKHALLTVAAAFSVFGLTYLAFSTLPSELMPKGDGRNMGILIELEPDASLVTAQKCSDSIGNKLRNLDYFESVTKYVGEKSPFSTTSIADQLSPSNNLSFVGFTTVFVPKDDRDKLAYEYVPDIERELGTAMEDCPGGSLLLSPSTGGASAESPIQVQILGDDMDELRTIAEQVVRELNQVEGTANVRHNLGVSALEVQAYPRSEIVNFYKMDNQSVADQIRVRMTSDEIGKFVVGGVEEDIKIRMGYAWPSRNGEIGGPTNLQEAEFLKITDPQGVSRPLENFVKTELSQSVLSIIHKNGRRTATVFADTKDDRTPGEILDELTVALDKNKSDWPPEYNYQFGGEASESAEVFGSSSVMLVLALFLVFALLVLQFDSFTQPAIIMTSIPLALTGMFIGFVVMQLPFSFMAMIGVIALIGIVVNDTIVMIDTMNHHAGNGMEIRKASARGAADRLRPILTTSITTIVGMIPLALSQKMWLPLGVTVIFGLIFSTILAMLVTPCLYVLFTGSKKEEEPLL